MPYLRGPSQHFTTFILHFNMKNLFSTLVLGAMILFVSCKKIDSALVTQMDEKISAMEGETDGFDMNTQGIVSFSSLVDSAPEGLKADTTSGFDSLQTRVTSLRIKQEGTVSEFREVLEELKKVSSEYQAGKIPTDKAREQYGQLEFRLTKLEELLTLVGSLNDKAQTEYGKMMAEYRSKTE